MKVVLRATGECGQGALRRLSSVVVGVGFGGKEALERAGAGWWMGRAWVRE